MNLFKKERWIIVKVIEAKVLWTDLNKEDTIIYYLSESNRGKRKCEIKATGQNYAEQFGYKHETYLKIVYPWLNGQNFDHIPDYFDMFKMNKEQYVRKIYNKFFK